MKRRDLLIWIFSISVLLVAISCSAPPSGNSAPVFNSCSPSDKATDVATNVKLSWDFSDPDNDALTFTVKLGDTEQNLQEVYSGSKREKTCELQCSTKYYWKVIADDSHGHKVETTLLEFTTVSCVNRKPKAPILVTPSDNSTDLSTTQVTLHWTCNDPDNDALTYTIYFSESTPPSEYQLTTNNSYDVFSLKPETTYYWKIKASDGEYSSESSIWRFTTASSGTNVSPTVPVNVCPPNGVSGVSVPATLTWQCSDEDGDDISFSVFLDSSTPLQLLCQTDEPFAIASDLIPNTEYFWQVKADDGHGHIVSSPIWSFTTAGLGNSPPSEPSDPSPSNGTTGVATEVVLSWECTDPEGDSLAYDIYFGESQDPPLIRQNLSDNFILIRDLEDKRTYYWKVAVKDGSHVVEGPLWWFRVGEYAQPESVVTLTDGGLYVVDYVGSTPALSSRVNLPQVRDLDVYGNKAYVVGNEEMDIVQLETLTVEATSDTTGSGIQISTLRPLQRIVAQNLYGCVTNDSSGLILLNVSDETHICLVSEVNVENAESLFVSGEHIYIPSDSKLVVINALDAYNPWQEGFYNGTSIADVYVIDNTAYVLDDSKVVKLDVSDPSNPLKTQESSVDFNSPSHLYVHDGQVYVVDLDGLTVLNGNLEYVDSIDILGINDVLASGDYLYLATEDGLLLLTTDTLQTLSRVMDGENVIALSLYK